MLLAVLIGFRHFFLQGQAHPGREITPPIRTLIIVHGISLTAWVLVFLVQSVLIATGNRRVHIMLGRIAAVLAGFIVVSGFWFNLASFRLAPPGFVVWTLTMKQFMILGFYTLAMFAGFVSVGLWYRKRPEIHRPMMLLATLSIMSPAIARIDVLNALYQGTAIERIFGPSLGMLVLGAAFGVLLQLQSVAAGRALPYVIGYGVLAATQLLIIGLARTNAWDTFATFLLR
jgi:hypothetical protein